LKILTISLSLIATATAAFGAMKDKPLVLAVEFNTHATAAYVARARGMYQAEGLHILAPTSTASGGGVREMETSASLVRLSIQVSDQHIVAEIPLEISSAMDLSVGIGVHIILKLRWLQPFTSKGEKYEHLRTTV
jgi:hypothetical protein